MAHVGRGQKESPHMAITAASIEANGWVLRLTVSGSPGSFASYILDPDGTPRISLVTTHPGFVQSGGIAMASSYGRTIVATKPLRKPVNPASPTTPVIDEVDNGDGTVTVRLALSSYVHATETSLALIVLAGWRAGEAAASAAVTSASTFAAALPIFRWADVPYQRSGGTITLELTVFSHHPVALQPVAGVKFTVTDGTTVKTAWATALSTSIRYGDSVRVYAVTIDGTAATALTAGLLRCDAEVYPWLGAMRSTDTVGTRSMTGLTTAGYGDNAASPFVIGYDPAGTRYGARVIYVDPAGTATANAAMVKPDLATAKALAVASRPRDITTAVQALYLANASLAAANGQGGQTRSADAARIVLAVGTHSDVGSTTITTGLTTAELPVRVEGDPDDANPRGNCILQTAAAGRRIRGTKAALSNLTIEVNTSALFDSLTLYYALDNIEVRGRAGSEAAVVGISGGTAPAGQWNVSGTRVKWWKTGSRMNGAAQRFGLIRACEASRRVEGLCVLGHRFISGGAGGEDSFQTAEENVISGWSGLVTAGAAEDVVTAGGDFRFVKGRVWTPVPLGAATAGTPNQSYRRLVFANNLCEKIANVGGAPFWSMGEDELATISYNLIEGCTFIGERVNCMYGDPLPTTIAETNTLINQAYGNRVTNCSFDWLPTKHDDFNDSQSQILRGTNGYRPQLTETWSVTYGVGWEGNYDWGRHPAAASFNFEYLGRRSIKVLAGTPAWPDDRCNLSGGTTSGGGSYKPAGASPLVGRGLRASVDRDRTGAARTIPFASGAVDTPAAATVAVAPASGLLASRSSGPALAWAGGLVPAGTRSATTASQPLLRWFAVLTPNGSSLASRAGASVVGFAAMLSPAGGMHALASGGPAIGIDGVTLLPAGGVASMADIGAAVLPELLFLTPRLVRIEGEVRIQLIPED